MIFVHDPSLNLLKYNAPSLSLLIFIYGVKHADETTTT